MILDNREHALGANLCPADQAVAIRRYPHRFTGDNTPAWARKPMPNGNPYPVQFKDDADWLAHSWFPVNANWRLASGPCTSRATWPNNPELRTKKFVERLVAFPSEQ